MSVSRRDRLSTTRLMGLLPCELRKDAHSSMVGLSKSALFTQNRQHLIANAHKCIFAYEVRIWILELHNAHMTVI